jgi:hypothetical protein
MLRHSENFKKRFPYETTIFKNYEKSSEGRLPEYIEYFKNTKFLLYQPLSEKWYPLNTDNLLKYLPDTCVKVSMAYLYNDAIWGGNFSGVEHDAIYGDIDLNGSSWATKERFDYCQNVLREREKHTDIKVADFIENNIKYIKLFYTQNHVTITLLREVCRQLFDILGMENDIIDIHYSESYGTSGGYGTTEDSRLALGLTY